MASSGRVTDSVLYQWILSICGPEKLTSLKDLWDGVMIWDVLEQIDDRLKDGFRSKLDKGKEDENSRLRNWSLITSQLLSFYSDMLDQTVVRAHPDVITLARDWTSAESEAALRCFLQLLLGGAVQGNNREQHIKHLQGMEVTLQTELAQDISQMTEQHHLVIPHDSWFNADMASHLGTAMETLATERNCLYQVLLSAKQEINYLKHLLEKSDSPITVPSSLKGYSSHLEVQQTRGTVLQLTVELEEKSKMLSELKEAVDAQGQKYSQLRMENSILSADAKLARSYRDELDAVSEKLTHLQKLQKDAAKYKTLTQDFAFYKSRTEDLQSDLEGARSTVTKQKAELESYERQLTSSSREKTDTEAKLHRTAEEKKLVEVKLDEVLEENAQLQFELKRAGAPSYADHKMTRINSDILPSCLELSKGVTPIAEELNETMSTQVTRLEVENNELRRELETMKLQLHATRREMDQVVLQSEQDYHRKKSRLNVKDQASSPLQQRNIKNQASSPLQQRNIKNQASSPFQQQTTKDQASSPLQQQNTKNQASSPLQQRNIKDQASSPIRPEPNNNQSVTDPGEDLDNERLENLQKVTGEKEKLLKQVKSVSHENELLHIEITALEKQVETKSTACDELTSRLTHAQQQVKALQKELMEKMSSNQKEQNKTIVEVQKHCEELETDRERARVELERLELETQEVSNKLLFCKAEMNDLQSQVDLEQEKYRKVLDEIQALQVQNKTLEFERTGTLENLKKLADTSEAELASLRAENCELRAKSTAMENLNSYLSNIPDHEQPLDHTYMSMHEGGVHGVADLSIHSHVSSREDQDVGSTPGRRTQGVVHSQSFQEPDLKSESYVGTLTDASFSSDVGFHEFNKEVPLNSTPNLGRRHERMARKEIRSTYCDERVMKEDNSKEQKTGVFKRLKNYVKPAKPSAGNNSSHADYKSRSKHVGVSTNSFSRQNPLRQTVQGSGHLDGFKKPHDMPPSRCVTPNNVASNSFQRNHPLRNTMPERRHYQPVSVFDQSRDSIKWSDGSQADVASPYASVRLASSSHHPCSVSSKYDGNISDTSSYKSANSKILFSDQKYSSSVDHSPPTKDENNVKKLSPITANTTNSKQTNEVEGQENSTSFSPHDRSTSERLKVFSDKIFTLQGDNRSLSIENSRLKKALERKSHKPLVIHAPTSGPSLEKEIADLKAENRKLKIIIETLQNTVSGKNPFDDKEYHYYTNV